MRVVRKARAPASPLSVSIAGVIGNPIAVTPETDGVGRRLRTARRGEGLTQKQLADELGVESITVSRWEREVTSPSLPRLRRIAELTGTTVSDLVRAPDTATAHAVELAALREELAETRQLVDRVARTLDQLVRTQSSAGVLPASRES